MTHRCRRIGGCLCWGLLLTASAATAAVPVEDLSEGESQARSSSTVRTTGAATDQQASAQTAQTSAQLRELFFQLQALQDEVRELRGQVEEQSYQIQRMEQRQQEQYRDLDGRVAELVKSGANTSTPALTSGTAEPGDAGSGDPPDRVRSTANVAGDERSAYTNAIDAMKRREFADSISQFNVFVQAYPNGELTPNAFYWLGELYLAQTDTERARQSFAQLLNLYPEHQKVPDALYKMGVVYHRLGDNDRALDYLQRVQSDHPDSTAAGLANTYASELQ